MADELGQVRMQLQLEKEALERARTQRAADRYTTSPHLLIRPALHLITSVWDA